MIEKRNTKQKTAIREAFIAANRPLSPDEAHAGAQQFYPALGTATVYRNIQSLVDEGWLQMVVVPGDSPRYEVAGKEHHHHFHCNDCGKLFELEGCIPTFKPKLPRGFRVTGHEFYLYGICSGCRTDLSKGHP